MREDMAVRVRTGKSSNLAGRGTPAQGRRDESREDGGFSDFCERRESVSTA
jgi:hypothetical protein